MDSSRKMGNARVWRMARRLDRVGGASRRIWRGDFLKPDSVWKAFLVRHPFRIYLRFTLEGEIARLHTRRVDHRDPGVTSLFWSDGVAVLISQIYHAHGYQFNNGVGPHSLQK